MTEVLYDHLHFVVSIVLKIFYSVHNLEKKRKFSHPLPFPHKPPSVITIN